VNLPMAMLDGIPVGLSLIGWRGSDAALVAAACAIARELATGSLQEPT
jgi:amidase